ncbi:universal stress protein [Halorarum salinum]|uniref:Universal stress protein n=1 Tax=Halorarum salinum TaxID=2743089 RepID=A0A7D5LB08_9EURY|nr:universal stress protein [Halobaculum salinum]QLG62227.1 universal stress protein [Halobaculum salinum]
MTPFDHLLVPIASEEDAEATCAALEPFLDDVGRVTAVHVIEKAGGAMDKAPLEKRQEDAATFLGVVDAALGDSVPVETRVAYGTDVVETLFREAAEIGATAIAFRPRGGSRLLRIISGDTASRLVTEPEIPVITLPQQEDA